MRDGSEGEGVWLREGGALKPENKGSMGKRERVTECTEEVVGRGIGRKPVHYSSTISSVVILSNMM